MVLSKKEGLRRRQLQRQLRSRCTAVKEDFDEQEKIPDGVGGEGRREDAGSNAAPWLSCPLGLGLRPLVLFDAQPATHAVPSPAAIPVLVLSLPVQRPKRRGAPWKCA